MNRTTKIRITELNPHVICVLCGGYYINATTITECLHSFCRTCITRYLETSKYCPVCDVMVHKTRPLDYIRSDKTLQDLVYKLVPGLYKNEMKRRREYYASVDTPGVSQPPSEDRGDEFYDRIIYTEDEKISLSLELCAEGIPFKTPINVHGHTGPENIRIKDVRYLQCPAAFSVGNLKKFIRMKFDLKLKYEIDIFHTAEPLPEYYSLMDIAYIYTWTRRAPLRLYYTVYERKLPPKAPDPIIQRQTLSADDRKRDGVPAKSKAENKNMTKKRKLLEGPDDISPDLAFEKCKPYKGGRKGIGSPKKRVKKALIEVDDSVKEAMSESEEQLARLTLESAGENKSVPNETGGSNLDEKQTAESVTDSKFVADDEKTRSAGSQNENVKIGGKVNNKTKTDEKCNPDILTNITVETNTQNGSGDSDINGATQNTKDSLSASKHSSAQVSPGSGSITLSLFQPLNAVGVESDDTDRSSSVNAEENISDKNTENMYEFQTEEAPNVSVKKSRGRPKGSKNKVNSEKANCVKKKTKESKLSETEANLVVSKKHPGIKSPKAKAIVKQQEIKDETTTKNSPVKAKRNDGASKVSLLDKGKSVNGEKTKRKYVRKNKIAHVGESESESKRPKKETKGDTLKDGSEKVPFLNEEVTEKLVHETPSSVEDVVMETMSDNLNVLSEKDVQNKESEKVTENVQGMSKTSEKNGDSDGEKQLPLNSNSLQEPVTPLYGETPKVNESNQGLPCSPNMDSLDNSGRLVIDTNENSDELNGANTKDMNDTSVSKCNAVQTNGAICENVNLKNGDVVSNCALTKEIYKNGFGSFEVTQSVNASRNNPEIPNAHMDQYRHNANGLSPTNTLNMLGAFTQSPMAAYLHIGHMTGNSNNYSSRDQSFDQPLDLTNNGTREEYTKGKIFKTKMLKKTYPKQDSVHSFKEKSAIQ